MTPAQIDLLQRLIAADHRHHALRVAGTPDHSANGRGIEVDLKLNSGHPRTAWSLVDAVLPEGCLPAPARRP